jgi:hypothetical protein
MAPRIGALAVWGDMLFSNTDNFFLDTDEEMYYSSVPPEWSREDVEWLTRAWRGAQEKQEAVFEMASRFEQAPEKLFTEVIDFITKQQELKDDAEADNGD